jgi:hypothetical protein
MKKGGWLPFINICLNIINQISLPINAEALREHGMHNVDSNECNGLLWTKPKIKKKQKKKSHLPAYMHATSLKQKKMLKISFKIFQARTCGDYYFTSSHTQVNPKNSLPQVFFKNK